MNRAKDVSVFIPTRDSLVTIKLILQALQPEFQECKPKIYIFENGSRDGTLEALCAFKHYNTFPDMDFVIKHFDDIGSIRPKSIELVRKNCCDTAKTKYLMFVDSDVLLPPMAILKLKDEFEQDPKLGMMGIFHYPNEQHVKMGATMLKTELAKKVKWKYDAEGCDCLNAARDIAARGYHVRHHPTLIARHLMAL
jgi:glycosyltransferase involved in cell wall biosynthesis